MPADWLPPMAYLDCFLLKKKKIRQNKTKPSNNSNNKPPQTKTTARFSFIHPPTCPFIFFNVTKLNIIRLKTKN
jgi:hypothetical protein